MKTSQKKIKPDHSHTAPLRSNSQPVIGFLCPEISYSVPREYWTGINDVVSLRQGNLVCLSGIGKNPDDEFLDLREVVFELVDLRNFDGLILWGNALFPHFSVEETLAFCNRYRPLPIVSIGSTPVDEIPEIVMGNYQGMYDAVEHLLKVHGYHKIVFIQGPKGHPEGTERYRAYADALEAYGLAVDPDLLLRGDFTPASGATTVTTLLDERGLRPYIDFDAVVATNDEMILSVSRILQERGIRIPDEVALVGFDNMPETQIAMPPLTTVQQPLYENGKLAAELLFEMLDGKEVTRQIITPTELVIRQSCGCMSPIAAAAGISNIHRVDQSLKAAMAKQRDEIRSKMVRTAGTSVTVSARATELLDNFVADLTFDPSNEQSPPKTFLPVLDNALKQTIPEGANIIGWQQMVSVLSNSLLPYLDNNQLLQAVGLLQQARIMIAETALQNQSNQTLLARNQADVLRSVSRSLRTTFNVKELVEVLVKNLPQLGISGCYLSLYEDPANPTEWSRLMLAYGHNKRIALEPEGRRFPSRQLMPEGILPHGQPNKMAVVPLTFKYQQLGFVLFEATPSYGPLCEAIGAELSTALQGAMLINQEAERVRELAQVNADLKAAQIELLRKERLATLGQLNAIVSHEIRNPLGTIRASAYSIDQKTRDKGLGVERALDRIQRNITRCDNIIGELLDYSREREVNPQTVRLDDWLNNVLSEQTIPKGITLSRDLSTGVEVSLDPERFRRVIVNLVENACHAIQEKPDAIGLKEIAVTTELVDQQIKLSIADTGSGIPPDVMPHIFEPLYSTKSFGVGLGLTVVQGIIQQHMGKIEVNSKIGKGTQIVIWLPLTAKD